MTVWWLGYLAADKALIDPMVRLCFYNTASANAFVQWGAISCFEEDDKPSEEMRIEYQKRRDYLVDSINKIDKLSCLKPKGAFYVFVNISKTGMDGESFSNYLLEDYGVATVPGINFGESGRNFIRMSYATSYQDIVKAIPRIKKAVEEI